MSGMPESAVLVAEKVLRKLDSSTDQRCSSDPDWLKSLGQTFAPGSV